MWCYIKATSLCIIHLIRFDSIRFNIQNSVPFIADIIIWYNNSVPYDKINKKLICVLCHFGKQSKLSFPTSTHQSLHTFDLLHIDIWNPITIQIPDGSTITVHFCGSVQLYPWICLTDELYSPQFKYNLISISKLTNNLHYNVIISHDFCGIQDPYAKKMIGHVELSNNLYILNHSTKTDTCTL